MTRCLVSAPITHATLAYICIFHSTIRFLVHFGLNGNYYITIYLWCLFQHAKNRSSHFAIAETQQAHELYLFYVLLLPLFYITKVNAINCERMNLQIRIYDLNLAAIELSNVNFYFSFYFWLFHCVLFCSVHLKSSIQLGNG